MARRTPIPMPQLQGLPSLPKDRSESGPSQRDRERLQRLRLAGRLKELDRQVLVPMDRLPFPSLDFDLPSLERISRLPDIPDDSYRDRAGSSHSDAQSDQGGNKDRIAPVHVTAHCTCEEFDKDKVVEYLKRYLSLPVDKWSRHEDSIYVRLPESVLPMGRRPRSLSFPSLSPRVSISPPLEQLESAKPRHLTTPLLQAKSESDAGLEEGGRFPDLEGTPLLGGWPLEADGDRCLVFFEYGVVVMWGLNEEEIEDITVKIVNPARLRELPRSSAETEEVAVCFCLGTEPPVIRNDLVTLPKTLRQHEGTRLAIAHALAQSTKLSVFEAMGLEFVNSTRHLPRELAETGTVSLSRTELAKMMGRLFVQRAEVDQLNSTLDIPEYFWSAPDSVQDLYKASCVYLEMEERIEAVNARLNVSGNMLEMLQNQHDVTHSVRLEWIVIILVALEGVVGFLEFIGTIGLIPKFHNVHYSWWSWWTGDE